MKQVKQHKSQEQQLMKDELDDLEEQKSQEQLTKDKPVDLEQEYKAKDKDVNRQWVKDE